MHAVESRMVRNVFLGLAGFTAVEVAAASIQMSHTTLLVFLLVTAVIKALLVALWFMHLKGEGRLILLMVAFPLIIGTLFVLGLLPDMVVARLAGT